MHIMEGNVKIVELNHKSENIVHFYPIFCSVLFDWGILKHGVWQLEWFSLGSLSTHLLHLHIFDTNLSQALDIK